MTRIKSTCIFISVLMLMGLASCSTVPPSQNPGRIQGLIKALNTEPVERLLERSNRPFLLDGEIIIREADMEALWQNLRNGGFTFLNAEILSVTPVGPESYHLFGTTKDAEFFFKKYVPKDGAIAEIGTDYGTFYIITGSRTWFTPKIIGFTSKGVNK
ncbi:MAG TPA: hypothetical protein PK897_01180 [Treponema sp.]|nr:hypothetical protein [Treponema sp.]